MLALKVNAFLAYQSWSAFNNARHLGVEALLAGLQICEDEYSIAVIYSQIMAKLEE